MFPLCNRCENCLSIDVDGNVSCALMGVVKMRTYCKFFKEKEVTKPKEDMTKIVKPQEELKESEKESEEVK